MVSGWLHCSIVLGTQSQSDDSWNKGAYEDHPPIWPKNKGSKGNRNTLTKHFKQCADIYGKRLVLLYILVPGKILTCPIPSQSARSLALARAVDRPTTRRLLDVCEEMKLVLDTMTSNTGPLSSPGNTYNCAVPERNVSGEVKLFQTGMSFLILNC